MTHTQWRDCPDCGTVMISAEIICPYCGHAVPPLDGASSSSLTSPYQSSAHNKRSLRLGIVWGTVAGIVQTEFGQLVFKYAHHAGNGWITANFVLVPFIAGVVSSFFWRKCYPTSTDLAGYSSQTAFLLVLVSFVLSWGGFAPFFLVGFFVLFMAVMYVVLLALATGFVWLGSLVGLRLFGEPA